MTDTIKLVRETWERNREAIRELRQCHADSCGTTLTETGMAGDKAICEMDAALAAEEPASSDGEVKRAERWLATFCEEQCIRTPPEAVASLAALLAETRGPWAESCVRLKAMLDCAEKQREDDEQMKSEYLAAAAKLADERDALRAEVERLRGLMDDALRDFAPVAEHGSLSEVARAGDILARSIRAALRGEE